MVNIKKIINVSQQREIERNFKERLVLIDGLEFFINNLLKKQKIEYIYIVIDFRVSREIYQIIINAIKKSKYKNKIQYCMNYQVYLLKDKKHIFFVLFESPSLIQHLYLKKQFFLTLKDLTVINDKEGLLKAKIPPIFNTIENCYKNIGVYFTLPFGKVIFSYLCNNRYISVTRINDELNVNKQGYTLKKEYDIVLILDLLDARKIYNEITGKEYLSFFWKNSLNQYNINYLHDVATQIIPQLVKTGVRVVLVQPVKTSRYISQAVEKSLRRDKGVRFLALDKRYRFKGKLIKDENLGKAMANTKGDFLKGYYRRFYIGNCYNFANGFRVVQNKGDAKNNIYFFGSCISCSEHTRDEDTLCNLIAKKVSPYYNVYSKTNNIENMNLVMRECFFKENDIVFLFFDDFFRYNHMREVYSFDLEKSLKLVPDLGIHMLDGMWQHLDKVAIKVLADCILDFLNEKSLIDSTIINDNQIEKQYFLLSHYNKRPMSVEMYGDDNLKNWLYGISSLKRKGVNGSIVMNCNPMTLGHMYLIEQAKSQVDNLYIFIVEEDSSEFSFVDRMDIVRNNLKNMENVIILPSGKYILSAYTLEGYFTKKDFCGMSIDASEDLELFLTIAQYMNITYRFIGSEPKDKFTKLYNEAMKEKLPQYGVKVIEIERLQIDNNFVSASNVRHYIEIKDWDAVKKIVPSYTFNYLISRFTSNNNDKGVNNEDY